MECTARKPGNVHPLAGFDDLHYDDLVRSAECVAPILSEARNRGVGNTIHDAVVATQQAVGKNTNLGIVLLLAPLAAVPEQTPLSEGIAEILQSLTRHDAELAYQAIRIANPGGMGSVDEADVSGEPTGTLLEMMQLAADRDTIAKQYSTNFALVLDTGLSLLESLVHHFPHDWETATIQLYLHLLAACPDTLIARKCGHDMAEESARRAQAVLDTGWPESDTGRQHFVDLENWLREEGNRRNPGTTADLVAATLFAGLREGTIECPSLFHAG